MPIKAHLSLSDEEIKVRVKKTWNALAKYGIFTNEQLEAAIKNMAPLNIGCMISPINRAEEAK